jgi:predicted O-methyltransferase YrrM
MKNQKAAVLIEAAKRAPAGLFAEIGCIREDHEVPQDGFSTVYLAKYCEGAGNEFISVDVEQKHVDIANAVLKDRGLPQVVRKEDGEKFLRELETPISFLPESSYYQFFEAGLAEGAVVVVDDAHNYDNQRHGKATYLVAMLDKQGRKYEIRQTEPGFAMLTFEVPNGKAKERYA